MTRPEEDDQQAADLQQWAREHPAPRSPLWQDTDATPLELAIDLARALAWTVIVLGVGTLLGLAWVTA